MAAGRAYAGVPAAQRRALRRAALVAAGLDIVGTQGSARLTVAGLCARAGLNERYFYESFASLDDALLAAFDEVCNEILSLAAQVIEDTPGTPEQRVHAVMQTFVDLVVTSPEKGKVAVLKASAGSPLRIRRNELIEVFADFVAREADELYGDRTWSADRARLFGIVYIAGFAELIGSWLNRDVELSPAELVETATDLFTALFSRA